MKYLFLVSILLLITMALAIILAPIAIKDISNTNLVVTYVVTVSLIMWLEAFIFMVKNSREDQ